MTSSCHVAMTSSAEASTVWCSNAKNPLRMRSSVRRERSRECCVIHERQRRLAVKTVCLLTPKRFIAVRAEVATSGRSTENVRRRRSRSKATVWAAAAAAAAARKMLLGANSPECGEVPRLRRVATGNWPTDCSYREAILSCVVTGRRRPVSVTSSSPPR